MVPGPLKRSPGRGQQQHLFLPLQKSQTSMVASLPSMLTWTAQQMRQQGVTVSRPAGRRADSCKLSAGGMPQPDAAHALAAARRPGRWLIMLHVDCSQNIPGSPTST